MTKFYYYSNSTNKPPGKGVNEELSSDENYDSLAKIKDWRKILSNFYAYPITLDDLQWATVEHYYQASKFKINNPQFFKQFSMCGSNFSIDPKKAKSAGGKSGGNFRPKSITMDTDFFTNNQKTCMLKALNAKFNQQGLPREVLLATGNAELWHGTRGVPPSRQYLLEEIRNNLGIKYSLDFIFKYSGSDLDTFIAQYTPQIYENLYDKRYMAMYYLYQGNYLDQETENLLVNNNFRKVLEISNSVQELRKNL
jgi:predicted NAD-dependent protein-ADP-ribosyltransferase YbiA (DUF1768 family)